MTERVKTLALGDPGSAFYRSLRQVLFTFGDLSFVDERSLDQPVQEVLETVEEGGFDQVLLPNPYGNETRLACYRALRERGVRVIASDRGALPDAWFFDRGFNFDSPSYEPDAWDHALGAEEEAAARAYVETLRGSSHALEKQGPRVQRDRLRQRLGLGEDERVLFVPLQRPADTVVRYFSGAVPSLAAMVDLVGELERQLNRGDERWRVVLKKHPLEEDYLVSDNPRLRYVTDDLHIHDLLEVADATLVLNSGVGLLSLLFGCATLHVGDAFYGHPGLSTKVSSAEEAAASLASPAPPDEVKVLRFVHHLLTRVYSFATFETELVRQKDGTQQRITRDMRFRELRILGEDVALPDAHVLVVTPVIPWPIYRGSQSRIDEMIRALMAANKLVSLVILNMSFNKASKLIVREMRERYPSVDRIEVRKHPKFDAWPRQGLRRLAQGFDVVTGGVHRIANEETCPRNFRRAVAQTVEQVRPDYLLVNYAKMTPAVPDSYEGVTVIDTHDFQTQFLREDQSQNGVRRHISLRTFERSEKKALQRYQRIIAINPLEAETFERVAPRARVHCVPAFTEPRPSRDIFLTHSHDALFVGSVSNFNVKGLLWFLDRVLPLVREERPTFRLAVVGNIARSKEIDAARYPEMDMLGVVPDLRASYEQTGVVIAPVLGGAGMKIKVIEAIGHRKAVVCTTRAAEGIDLVHGQSAWIADDPEGFARGLLELLASDETRKRIEAEALALHARDHCPDAIQRALARVFE